MLIYLVEDIRFVMWCLSSIFLATSYLPLIAIVLIWETGRTSAGIDYQRANDASLQSAKDILSSLRLLKRAATIGSTCVRRCDNGGSAVITHKGNCVCNCAEGFTGKNCDDSGISTCVRRCDNGGSAVINHKGNCVCNCANGFTGKNCDDSDSRTGIMLTSNLLKENATDGSSTCVRRCDNGGSAVINHKGNCVCNCANGFTGKNCEDSGSCRQCQHGGAAKYDTKGRCICECLFGYKGHNCHSEDTVKCQPVFECESNENLKCPGDTCCTCEPCRICENGGTAVKNGTKCICSCLFGYRGNRCQAPMSSKETGGCTPMSKCQNNITLICPEKTCCYCNEFTPPEPNSVLLPVS